MPRLYGHTGASGTFNPSCASADASTALKPHTGAQGPEHQEVDR